MKVMYGLGIEINHLYVNVSACEYIFHSEYFRPLCNTLPSDCVSFTIKQHDRGAELQIVRCFGSTISTDYRSFIYV